MQQVRTVSDLPVRQFLVDVCCFGDRSEIMREGTENIGENDHLFVLSTSSLKSKTTTAMTESECKLVRVLRQYVIVMRGRFAT